MPIANAGSAAGRTVAACAVRVARTARAGVRAGSAEAIAAAGVNVGTDGVNTDGRFAGPTGLVAAAAAVDDARLGRLPVIAGLAVGSESAGRVRRGAGSGRALIGSALAAGSVAGLRPRRVARLPGAGDCSASPDPDALVGFAGPPDFGADTDEVSS